MSSNGTHILICIEKLFFNLPLVTGNKLFDISIRLCKNIDLSKGEQEMKTQSENHI